ncbi:MAG: hypothetical protein ABFD92_19805 [Planctomycetaceae bacterium]|nr:hypothetical protein [Planctomycetaceae bacterium]
MPRRMIYGLIALVLVAVATALPLRTLPNGSRTDLDAISAATKKKKTTAPVSKQKVTVNAPKVPANDVDDAIHQRVAGQIDAARRAISAKNWQQARETLEPLLGVVRSSNQRERIDELLAKVDAEGEIRLQKANTLYTEKKYEQALKGYRAVATIFGQRKAAHEAQAALDKAENDPVVASAFKASKAQAMADQIQAIITTDLAAQKLPAPATQPASESDGDGPTIDAALRFDYLKKLQSEPRQNALKLLEMLATLYPDTPAGKQAASDMALVKADKDLQQQMAADQNESRAKQILTVAGNYEKAGMDKIALGKYQEFLKLYPARPEAADVAKRVEALKTKLGQ